MKCSSGDGWKGKKPKDGPPKFGRKAQRWFRHAVFQWLTTEPEEGQAHVRDDSLAWKVVDWYLEEHGVYVTWVPGDGYYGPRYSWGSWRLDEVTLTRDVRRGLQEVHNRCAAVVADSIASLDDWLRADLNGTLPIAGALGASVLFSDERKRDLHFSMLRLTEYGPIKQCKVCDHRFRSDRQHRAYCHECRAAGKAPARKGASSSDGAKAIPLGPRLSK